MEDSRRYKGGKERGEIKKQLRLRLTSASLMSTEKKSTDHLVTFQIETPGRAAFPSLSEKGRHQNLSLSRNNPLLPFKFRRNVPHINPVGANHGRKLENGGQEGKTSILSVIAIDQG